MDADAWDTRYRDAELLWSAEPNQFVAAELADLPAGTALDLACGEGRNAVWLAGRGWRVTAVDFSPVAVDRGRSLASARDVEVTWLVEDIVTWRPPDVAFDAVVVAYLQLPIEELARVLPAAAAAVAPGGVLVAVGHDRDNLTRGYGGPSDPALLWTADGVAGLLEGLTVERAEQVTRAVATDEGERTAIDVLVRARRRVPEHR